MKNLFIILSILLTIKMFNTKEEFSYNNSSNTSSFEEIIDEKILKIDDAVLEQYRPFASLIDEKIVQMISNCNEMNCFEQCLIYTRDILKEIHYNNLFINNTEDVANEITQFIFRSNNNNEALKNIRIVISKNIRKQKKKLLLAQPGTSITNSNEEGNRDYITDLCYVFASLFDFVDELCD